MSKRITNIFFIFFIILLISACGQNESGSLSVTSEDVDENNTGKNDITNIASWKTSHISLNAVLEQAVVKDDIVYGCYTTSAGIAVATQNLQTGEVNEVTITGADYAQCITVDQNGNIYVLGVQDEEYRFWEISKEGTLTILENFTLEDTSEEYMPTPKGLYVDDSGYFYIWYGLMLPSNIFFEGSDEKYKTAADRIYVKDSELNTLYYEQVAGSNGYLLLGFGLDENGVPVMLVQDPDGNYLEKLGDTKKACEKVELNDSGTSQLTQFDHVFMTDGGFLYCNGSYLCRYLLSSQTTENILDLTDFGISSSNIVYMGMRDCSIEIIDHFGNNSVSEYTLIEEGETEKTVVTFGIIAYDFDYANNGLADIVTEFNRYHEKIRIEVVNYYDEGQEDGASAGATQLQMDILQGSAPDILEVSLINAEILAGMGAFENLYVYMDQDEECSRDMLIENVLNVYEVNSGLYYISPAFSLSSMWGSSTFVQGRYGITLSEMVQILNENGGDINSIFGFSADESVLTTLCTMGMDEFIDWDNGTCDFESEAFLSVLEFANEYQGNHVTDDREGIAEGKVLLSLGQIHSVTDYQIQCELYGEQVEYIGYPTASGSGTAVYYRGSNLAINADSSLKSEAWEFVKYYLLNGYRGGGFPVVKAQFDEVMTRAMTDIYISTDVGEERVAKASYGDILVYKADQSDVDTVRALVERADCKYEYQTEIQAIINEEASYYFAGQKDIQEVAALIQNRVSLYIAEQMD